MYNYRNINLQLDNIKSIINKVQADSTRYMDTLISNKSTQTLNDNIYIDWVTYAIKLCETGYKNKIFIITYKNGSTQKKRLNSLTYSNGEYDPKLDGILVSTIQYNIINMTPYNNGVG